jgi:hypothetical protein
VLGSLCLLHPKTLKSSLQGLRGAVQQALQLVPESCLVGLITFGATVQGAVPQNNLNQIPPYFRPHLDTDPIG